MVFYRLGIPGAKGDVGKRSWVEYDSISNTIDSIFKVNLVVVAFAHQLSLVFKEIAVAKVIVDGPE